MKRISFGAVTGLLVLGTVFLTGCFSQADISGTYTTAVNADRADGPGWQETAEILLRQIGASLTGNMTLHHPVPERCRFPSLGSLQNGKVVFVGYTTMPFGTVDLKFTGVVKTSHIEGGVNVELDSLFCEEHDSATLKMSKA